MPGLDWPKSFRCERRDVRTVRSRSGYPSDASLRWHSRALTIVVLDGSGRCRSDRVRPAGAVACRIDAGFAEPGRRDDRVPEPGTTSRWRWVRRLPASRGKAATSIRRGRRPEHSPRLPMPLALSSGFTATAREPLGRSFRVRRSRLRAPMRRSSVWRAFGAFGLSDLQLQRRARAVVQHDRRDSLLAERLFPVTPRVPHGGAVGLELAGPEATRVRFKPIDAVSFTGARSIALLPVRGDRAGAGVRVAARAGPQRPGRARRAPPPSRLNLAIVSRF